ncbi:MULTISPECIES: APC family permease [Pseudomonas]|uniref:Amino acid permease/ SLC12A domain-containing protein n=1 Tax=Pseudomonas putida TaxID=303 RepID=A0A2S3XCK2_PSEPU|nr:MULTISPECIES: APC family permease [Pseudomonas]PTC01754.1 APC family permease [Thalassospira xiamenensis]AVD83775.1 amino acid permease [Pseudomonas sp. SWI6]AVD95055.1 amino acid permease [Pseudomonas sp. SWI36]ELU0814307.1 APC family permease [Pseudomonas putida]MBH3388639.1 APC family permease [Pseudomonas putida]
MTSPNVERSEDPGNKQLKGNLGPIGIAMMVVATAAPLTVMAGISPLVISFGNGIAAPVDALTVGFVMLLFSVGFVAMSKYIDNAGAFYAYILKGMGRVFGLGAASLAVFSYTLVLIALEAYLGIVLSNTFSSLTDMHVPWWVFTVMVIGFVGFLGYRNVELSAKVLGVALVLEILVIMFVDLSVIINTAHGGFSIEPFSVSEVLSGSPGLGLLFTIFGFIGFESTVVYREEAVDPERSIPKATYIAVGFISLLYCVSFYCVVTGIGLDKVVDVATHNPEGMYLDLVSTYLGHVAKDAAQLLLITSLFAVVISIHNIVARYKYVLGSCGVLMAQLARVHDVHCSPYVASAVQTIVSIILIAAAVLLGLDPATEVYATGAAAGTLGYMMIVVLACLSVILYFARHQGLGSAWKTKFAPGLAFVALSGFLYIALMNLSALTGSEGSLVNTLIIVALAVAFLIGSLGGIVMKIKAPKRFDAILDAMR